MIEDFKPMTCSVCSAFLGFYYFDREVQVRYTAHCQNCQIRLTLKEKNITINKYKVKRN